MWKPPSVAPGGACTSLQDVWLSTSEDPKDAAASVSAVFLGYPLTTAQELVGSGFSEAGCLGIGMGEQVYFTIEGEWLGGWV